MTAPTIEAAKSKFREEVQRTHAVWLTERGEVRRCALYCLTHSAFRRKHPRKAFHPGQRSTSCRYVMASLMHRSAAARAAPSLAARRNPSSCTSGTHEPHTHLQPSHRCQGLHLWNLQEASPIHLTPISSFHFPALRCVAARTSDLRATSSPSAMWTRPGKSVQEFVCSW